MAEIEFIFNDIKTTIQCNINEMMKDICGKYVIKIDKDFNKIYFVYNGKTLNNDYLNLSFIQNANEIVKKNMFISK